MVSRSNGLFCFILTSVLLQHVCIVAAKSGLCEVETGQSSIILDIEESRGNSIDKKTMPETLPINGDPNTEVILDLIFPSVEYFALDGKKLQLIEPLDRDKDNISHVLFQLTCQVRASSKKRTIPVIVRVSDVNDNAPVFQNLPYETTISELTPEGSTVFPDIYAEDKDAGVNGVVEYFIVEGHGENVPPQGTGTRRVISADGYDYFSIPFPLKGTVQLARALDYERTQRYLVTIVASDRARNVSERFSTTTTLTVNVKDDDDQDPSFIYQGCMLLDGACINPEYSATVNSGILSGILNINPDKIQAIDMDTIGSKIEYSFASGSPSDFDEYFEIHGSTGAVRQTKAIDATVLKQYDIVVKATEVSETRRSATAKLRITVKPVDLNRPEIRSTAFEGFVDENASPGVQVRDVNGEPIVLDVTDADLGPADPKPNYKFELTTSAFTIDGFGALVVNEPNLDRDPPNPGKFIFQIIARESLGNVSSAPLTITVHLNDLNDNKPLIANIPPLLVPAGLSDSSAPRIIHKIDATDLDADENARIVFSLVSTPEIRPNGPRFHVDPRTGILESTGQLNAGEEYTLTVQATDAGGLFSQANVDIRVVPGPNLRGPVFERHVYDVQVSEGAVINTTVGNVVAQDPDGDPVTYSIINGNDLRQFGIGANSGIITVRRKLDREDLNKYQLLVKAEDPGRLSATATVNVKITDINDKNPEFQNLPYEFQAREQPYRPPGVVIGAVTAVDLDEGPNAQVQYSVPDDVPFAIDEETGQIRTRMNLDYESKAEYKFVVTARDRGTEPRISTATVTVHIRDVEDESPVFTRASYEAKVPENVPQAYVTRVEAKDPDTIPRVTYEIKQGPVELFRVDAVTGEVWTRRGLDYERESQHVLIIGTVEGDDDERPETVTKVYVDVEDRNDIPPVFTSIPRAVTLDDEAPIGFKVIQLEAVDSDGTAPNNKVRYELVGPSKAMKYYQIDTDTGVVEVRDDLRKDNDSEHQITIRAYDLGNPQLSSELTATVYVRHVATVAPEVGLAFVDDSYSTSVPENLTAGSILKTFAIANRELHVDIPLKCYIVSGNEKDIFAVNVTHDRNCVLYLRGALDYETTALHVLELQLDSIQGLVNPAQSSANVRIYVQDVNDNIPRFIVPRADDHIGSVAYYGAVPHDAPIMWFVLQVKAVDEDAGKFGQIEYSFASNDLAKEYLTLDGETGIVKTRKSFEGLDTMGPLKFQVRARDNPKMDEGMQSNEALVDVVVNVITPRNRLVLVMADTGPDKMADKERVVADIIETHSRLLIGIEKFVPRQFLNVNGTWQSDHSATDVYFYAIDPDTGVILENNSTRVKRSILGKANNITYDLTANLKHTAAEIHVPVTQSVVRLKAATLSNSGDVIPIVMPYALIALASIIFILGTIGVVYICISWSRYKTFKSQANVGSNRLYSSPTPNLYDQPAPTTFIDPKEYETQVLQMSVPLDAEEHEYTDLQFDFSTKRNHAFNLDSVGYITRDEIESGEGGAMSGGMGVAGGGTMRKSCNLSQPTTFHATTMSHDYSNQVPIYNNDRDLDPGAADRNVSVCDDNFMFQKKKDFGAFSYLNERNSLETTTEL